MYILPNALKCVIKSGKTTKVKHIVVQDVCGQNSQGKQEIQTERLGEKLRLPKGLKNMFMR